MKYAFAIAAFIAGMIVSPLLESLVSPRTFPNIEWLITYPVKPLVDFVPERLWPYKGVEDDAWGIYDSGKNLIRLRVPNPCILKTVEHEVGHYREGVEGFDLQSNHYARVSRCLGVKRGEHKKE